MPIREILSHYQATEWKDLGCGRCLAALAFTVDRQEDHADSEALLRSVLFRLVFQPLHATPSP